MNKNWPIRLKILCIVLGGILTLSAAFYFIFTNIISTSYSKIENDEILGNLNRGEDVLNKLLVDLNSRVSDWAHWDDAYKYAGDKNSLFESTNLLNTSLSNVGINVIVFIDKDQNVLFQKSIDLNDQSSTEIPSFTQYLESHKDLASKLNVGESLSGIIDLPEGSMMMAMQPIVKSDNTGPVNGVLVFGKFLNESVISSISDLLHLTVNIYRYDDSLIPKSLFPSKDSYFINPISNNSVVAYKVVNDIYEKPVVVMKISMDRPIYSQGKNTAYTFILIVVISIFLFGIILIFLLDRFIISRLTRLNKDVEKISQTKDLSGRLNEGGQDEIGKLAGMVNHMLTTLSSSEKSQKEANDKINIISSQLKERLVETESSKKAILNLLEDIDREKKSAEGLVIIRTQELSDEKARLVASINSLSFGFIIADANDKILLKNPAINKLLELTEDPKTLHDVADSFKVAVNSVPAEFDLVGSCRKCMELKHVVELKDVLYNKKFLRVFCAPIIKEGIVHKEDEEIPLIGYVFLLEDVTEAKVMERSREEFFAVASHELRTPLTAIRGNAEMILDMYGDKIKDPDMGEMLRDINASSLRLIELVNDFLEVSRLEQGRFEIKKESFPASEVLGKVLRDLQSLAINKGLSMDFIKPTFKEKNVFADRNRVEQIIVNLIGNALKFTKKGGITLAMEDIDNFIKITVTDTGIGISENNQNLLFRKFQQAGEQVLARDITQGSGLGLYISQLIISNMGGTIGLQTSTLGKGSTFAFTLPVAP